MNRQFFEESSFQLCIKVTVYILCVLVAEFLILSFALSSNLGVSLRLACGDRAVYTPVLRVLRSIYENSHSHQYHYRLPRRR